VTFAAARLSRSDRDRLRGDRLESDSGPTDDDIIINIQVLFRS
jgi:hypothetical protein